MSAFISSGSSLVISQQKHDVAACSWSGKSAQLQHCASREVGQSTTMYLYPNGNGARFESSRKRLGTGRNQVRTYLTPVAHAVTVESGKLTLHGKEKQHAFEKLYKAVVDAGATIESAFGKVEPNGDLKVTIKLCSKSNVAADAISPILEKTYAALPDMVLSHVERGYTDPSVHLEHVDVEKGLVCFVDNSACPAYTTLSLGYVSEGPATPLKYFQVFEHERVYVKFAVMRGNDGVRSDILHVVNGHGDQLDEPHRIRLSNALCKALSS